MLSFFRIPSFFGLCFLMLCAGAAEIAMAQWASVFAQKGLGVDKALGDIAGPCLFAVLMGLGRTLYGFFATGKSLKRTLIISSVCCFICYSVTGITNNPVLSLATCALTGVTVSIMWPGVYSFSAKKLGTSATAMYGILALFGDMGCSVGSWLCGTVSELSLKLPQVLSYADKISVTPEQMGLKIGIIVCGLSALFMTIALAFIKIDNKKKQ